METRKLDDFLESKLFFDTREEAEKVLDQLLDIIDDYGYASVADLKQISGMTSGNFSNTQWGWHTTNDKFYVMRRDKKGKEVYTLILPDPAKHDDKANLKEPLEKSFNFRTNANIQEIYNDIEVALSVVALSNNPILVGQAFRLIERSARKANIYIGSKL